MYLSYDGRWERSKSDISHGACFRSFTRFVEEAEKQYMFNFVMSVRGEVTVLKSHTMYTKPSSKGVVL